MSSTVALLSTWVISSLIDSVLLLHLVFVYSMLEKTWQPPAMCCIVSIRHPYLQLSATELPSNTVNPFEITQFQQISVLHIFDFFNFLTIHYYLKCGKFKTMEKNA